MDCEIQFRKDTIFPAADNTMALFVIITASVATSRQAAHISYEEKHIPHSVILSIPAAWKITSIKGTNQSMWSLTLSGGKHFLSNLSTLNWMFGFFPGYRITRFLKILFCHINPSITQWASSEKEFRFGRDFLMIFLKISKSFLRSTRTVNKKTGELPISPRDCESEITSRSKGTLRNFI